MGSGLTQPALRTWEEMICSLLPLKAVGMIFLLCPCGFSIVWVPLLSSSHHGYRYHTNGVASGTDRIFSSTANTVPSLLPSQEPSSAMWWRTVPVVMSWESGEGWERSVAVHCGAIAKVLCQRWSSTSNAAHPLPHPGRNRQQLSHPHSLHLPVLGPVCASSARGRQRPCVSVWGSPRQKQSNRSAWPWTWHLVSSAVCDSQHRDLQAQESGGRVYFSGARGTKNPQPPWPEWLLVWG